MFIIEIRRGDENAEAQWHVSLKEDDRVILRSTEPVVKEKAMANAKALKFQRLQGPNSDGQREASVVRPSDGGDTMEICLFEGAVFRIDEEITGGPEGAVTRITELLADAEIVWCPASADPAAIHRKSDHTRTRGIPGS